MIISIDRRRQKANGAVLINFGGQREGTSGLPPVRGLCRTAAPLAVTLLQKLDQYFGHFFGLLLLHPVPRAVH